MPTDLVVKVRAALQRQLVHAILDNDRVARAHGLRVTDLQTLHLLVLRDDIRTPQQISDATGMPTSTVTKLIDRLESAGYIRRTPDEKDRRKTLIQLISEKIEPLSSFYGRVDEEFDQVAHKFDDAELDTVIRYLDDVSEFYALRK